MFLPVLLLFLATLSAAVMAYGTSAVWAQYAHGFEFILFARRFQWPLATLSLLLCIVLLGLVISGRKRAWWLIGLGPVLALFAHRFVVDPSRAFAVIEEPAFASAADAGTFVGDDDWVVGLTFAGESYAYPYAVLFGAPVVVHADHDRRLAVMWSAYANRAIAVQVTRELRGADLTVVSTPANALLVYNTRLGEFINAVTGLTPAGERPSGFRERVPITKTTWKAWRAAHPETRVMPPASANYAAAPRAAIRPTNPMPRASADSDPPPETRVIVAGVQKPVAVRSDQATPGKPLNLRPDDAPMLVFRDPDGGALRAFERRVDDLRPRFDPNPDRRRRPKVLFVDADTGAGWDAAGRFVDGPPEMKGKRLSPAIAEDGLYWGVMKHWYPDLQFVQVDAK